MYIHILEAWFVFVDLRVLRALFRIRERSESPIIDLLSDYTLV